MSRKFDALFVHESVNANTGKKYSAWYKVGYAHESDNGMITLRLATIPAGTDAEGMYKIVLKEPRPRDDGDSGLGF